MKNDANHAVLVMPSDGADEQSRRAELLVEELPHAHADEQSCRADDVVSLFANQQGLVKTVKNDDWLRFVHQLHSGPFRSSVSLPPPGGRRMCLFGRLSAGEAHNQPMRGGTVWARSAQFRRS